MAHACSCFGVLLTIAVVSGCGAQVTVERDGGGGSGGAPPGPVSGCAEPSPILQAGTDLESGFVRCADGLVQRSSAAVCTAPATPGNCGQEFGDCASDAECGDKPYGACIESNPWMGCACDYGCATDADCDAGDICACAGVVGGRARCLSAGCVTSDDCTAGLCALSQGVGSCGEVYGQVACLTVESPCRVDDDCAAEELIWCQGDYTTPQCRLLTGEWACSEPHGCGPCG